MADIIEPDSIKEITLGEHDSTTTPTKKVLAYGWDGTGLAKVRQSVDSSGRSNIINVSQLVPKVYDYVALGYTGDNLTSVVYKAGGAGGSTVATLTLAYTGAVLDSITRT